MFLNHRRVRDGFAPKRSAKTGAGKSLHRSSSPTYDSSVHHGTLAATTASIPTVVPELGSRSLVESPERHRIEARDHSGSFRSGSVSKGPVYGPPRQLSGVVRIKRRDRVFGGQSQDGFRRYHLRSTHTSYGLPPVFGLRSSRRPVRGHGRGARASLSTARRRGSHRLVDTAREVRFRRRIGNPSDR